MIRVKRAAMAVDMRQFENRNGARKVDYASSLSISAYAAANAAVSAA